MLFALDSGSHEDGTKSRPDGVIELVHTPEAEVFVEPCASRETLENDALDLPLP